MLSFSVACLAGFVDQQFDKSPRAACVKDHNLGFSAIFRPLESCLSGVILVLFVQYLGMLNNLDLYKNMYGPYFADIEIYVDGTWCDLYEQENIALPCCGEPLDRYVQLKQAFGS